MKEHYLMKVKIFVKHPSLFFLPCAFFTIFVWRPAFAVESVDVDNEINRVKKELSQVQAERQRVAEDITKDAKEFADYEQRTASRKSECAAETDSIKRQTALTAQKSDSLGALVSGSQLKRKQYELLQESFRQSVIAACARLTIEAKKTPNGNANQANGALTFLVNDCRSKTIDNIEALHRLLQIIQNLDEAGGTIRVGQEPSAVPEIRGNASTLQIGNVFEAVVDDDAKVCAFWRGVGNADHQEWEVIRDPQVASLVLRAINVRQGKALPSFIDLPYGVSAAKGAKK